MAELLANRYELIGRVAEGALAAIWRGEAHGEGGFRRPVAVRVLREPWDRERTVLGAWAATATDLASQPSPHVEQALDFIAAEGRTYVVTEWIEGISLRRWLFEHARDDKPVPWPLAAAVAVEVLRGLTSAHAANPPICHEGIDPRSVRLARTGTVKLTRYGVASALAVRGAGRRKLEELGLRHPVPELLDGGGSSPASDLFGVGALLFELLSGAPLFPDAPGDARDDAVRRGEHRDLSAVRADVPPLLVAHVERALAPEPESRFASASAMVRALTQLLQAELEPSGPEAIAASVAGVLDRPRPEVRPQGLVEQPTMHVELTELTVLPRVRTIAVGEPAPVEPPSEPDPAEHEQPEAERRPRYHFGYNERRASLTAREQEPEPLPLVRRVEAEPARPPGLAPQRTEFLDEDQVDRLTLPDAAKRPPGLAPQKTEFLDEDQVDRLTLPERAPKR